MRQIVKKPLCPELKKQVDAKIAARKSYGDLCKQQKDEIKQTLLESQHYLCCYCECRIDQNCHIEHFYEQSDYNHGVHDIHPLDYVRNLIVSCEGDRNRGQQPETAEEKAVRKANTSCGHKKGRSYHNNVLVNYDLLLNPQEDISHLFSYSYGYISAHSRCTVNEKQQVDYTIKRLALNCNKLTKRRIAAIEALNKQIENSDEQNIETILQGILDETQTTLPPFFSTLKDNFSFLLS